VKKALSIEILGFKGEIGLIEGRWDEWFRDIKQILTSLGEISDWFGEKEEGEVSHASLELIQGKNMLHLWSKVN